MYVGILDVCREKKLCWKLFILIQNDIEATKCASPTEKCGILVVYDQVEISDIGICDRMWENQSIMNTNFITITITSGP